MARTALTPTRPTRAGAAQVAEVAGDTTNGNVVANTGRTVIVVRNADTSAHTVTFVIPGTVDGQPVEDRTVSVPADSTLVFGGFPVEWYTQQLAIDVDSDQLMLQALEP